MTIRRTKRFLLCVRNEGCNDLQRRKLYESVRDSRAEAEGYVRVIDDSGERYLYPESYFEVLDLPATVSRRLARTTNAPSTPVQRPARARRR